MQCQTEPKTVDIHLFLSVGLVLETNVEERTQEVEQGDGGSGGLLQSSDFLHDGGFLSGTGELDLGGGRHGGSRHCFEWWLWLLFDDEIENRGSQLVLIYFSKRYFSLTHRYARPCRRSFSMEKKRKFPSPERSELPPTPSGRRKPL